MSVRAAPLLVAAGVLRAELRKLLTLPWLWLVVAVVPLVRQPLHAQVCLLVLGALAATSEFPAQIATTLLAVPRRTYLMAAKLVAVALVATPVSLAAAAGPFWWLLASALLAASIGTILRNAAGTIAVLLTLHLFVVPLVTTTWIPYAWTAAGILAATAHLRFSSI